MDKTMYSVEDVVKRLHITPRTLHYYEELGLIVPSDRTQGGHRLYNDQVVERVSHILRLKDTLGYSLQEIREFLGAEEDLENLRSSYHEASDEEKQVILTDARRLLEGIIAHIDDKIGKLQFMRSQALERLERTEQALAQQNKTK